MGPYGEDTGGAPPRSAADTHDGRTVEVRAPFRAEQSRPDW